MRKKVTTAKLAEKLYNCLNLKHDTEYKNLVNSTSINADNDEVHAQTGIFNFLSNLFSFQNTNTLINSDPKDNIIDALFLFGNIKDKLKLLCKTDKADLQELNPNYCPSVQTGEIMLKLYTIFRDMPEYIEPGTMNKYDLIMELITKLSTVLYDWATSLNVETPEICNDVFNIDPKISFLIKNAAEEVAILLLEKKAAEIQECNAELLISIAGNDSEDMLDYPFADHDCSIIFENTNIEVEGSIFLPEEL
ncbi:hypothetical protein I862_05420 [endosymbiont of Acanthamoeba sp. UWC8]|uniref:hypothetical protein n=1 Tax=endosymbiont of Acanthamoeba sp. UWC8 TaxID=86106 RepID=UPI0004D1A4DE|nr:hypothetical protein [endosymbiont of Acanthamoeba sp. UWC8]AIF81638.1 hypothetical protein I862_05420 [endosymbiont of Acanthamoeba sp. UWC8]